MGECSALYTIPIIAWDNNVVNNTGSVLSESFGFIDRATGNVVHQDLVDAMTDDYVK
jgi:endoglucanase